VKVSRRSLLASGVVAGMAATAAKAAPAPSHRPLAPKPPMGWNSWNSFATTITEAQTLENARIMARELLPSGYDILTVDIQWYDPSATGYDYNAKPVPAMDGHGRLLPAPNRFPSSAGGNGFAPLASRVHAMGLRFGVHLLRGIPRLAVERDLPVLGTQTTARAIADTSSICAWNPDMYGVDMRRPGAQAYYDSVFKLLASWGVDFVKVDDLSRPYDAHAPEIEAIALAIARSGRPMVLSMSPGETPVSRAAHASQHAQMWRISDDFWDDWAMLKAQFTRLANWNGAMKGLPGWPDADMLPLGRLKMGTRETNFTPDEQQTLMTLWSIARSPLIMGGDLRHLSPATLALLTNPEVLAVNQSSHANQPHFWDDDAPVWSARGADGASYLALFNTGEKARQVTLDLPRLGLPGSGKVRDLWQRKDEGQTGAIFARDVPPHGARLYKLSAT
jgi:hypothetical protein